VQLLIQHGAGVTEKDEGHSTLLHLASSTGIAEIVQLLIECGADVTAQDGSHRTPLHLVSSLVSCNMASLIFQPDVNTA
jgi:ankyrin repeat protein